MLDDIRIWSVARSASEIAGSLRSELTTAPAGLLANWRFNDTGGMAADLTDRHRATLDGGATFVIDAH